ncbi:MAG TPA: FAD-dependent oxidoreductase [Leptolyngbyaceae cyanobacterium M65_K2018_010]|nr:FAD-dependent oxidoreductase [Leptolyngbyaceae cyanobacterium M65_K2018_010]
MAQWDVGVVGAGLSGLTAARQLTQDGWSVLVLDKSRGLGGRVATRRVQGTGVDHGCRFMQPWGLGPGFGWAQAQSQGWLQPWNPVEFELSQAGLLSPRPAQGPYYVAAEGMSSLAKVLAQGLEIQRLCRVEQLIPRAEGWQLQVESQPEALGEVTVRTVLLALPAPQIPPLLTAALPLFPELGEWLEPLGEVVFDPVITVMAGYGADTVPRLGEDATTAATGWMVTAQEPSPLWWAALDSSKRLVAAHPVVVLHSHAQFAASHLEAADLTPVGQQLLEQAAHNLAPWLGDPHWMQVHRWRYGLVRQPLPSPFLSTAAVPTLVGCGDWCGGQDGAAAIASGQAAASHLAQWLQTHS